MARAGAITLLRHKYIHNVTVCRPGQLSVYSGQNIIRWTKTAFNKGYNQTYLDILYPMEQVKLHTNSFRFKYSRSYAKLDIGMCSVIAYFCYHPVNTRFVIEKFASKTPGSEYIFPYKTNFIETAELVLDSLLKECDSVK